MFSIEIERKFDDGTKAFVVNQTFLPFLDTRYFQEVHMKRTNTSPTVQTVISELTFLNDGVFQQFKIRRLLFWNC